MNVLETIKFLVNPERMDELLLKEDLPLDTDVRDFAIYCIGEIDLLAEIKILSDEETDNDIIYEKDGISYICLFDIWHAIDLIENDLELKGKGYSDKMIGDRLIEYRKNDA